MLREAIAIGRQRKIAVCQLTRYMIEFRVGNEPSARLEVARWLIEFDSAHPLYELKNETRYHEPRFNKYYYIININLNYINV